MQASWRRTQIALVAIARSPAGAIWAVAGPGFEEARHSGFKALGRAALAVSRSIVLLGNPPAGASLLRQGLTLRESPVGERASFVASRIDFGRRMGRR